MKTRPAPFSPEEQVGALHVLHRPAPQQVVLYDVPHAVPQHPRVSLVLVVPAAELSVLQACRGNITQQASPTNSHDRRAGRITHPLFCTQLGIVRLVSRHCKPAPGDTLLAKTCTTFSALSTVLVMRIGSALSTVLQQVQYQPCVQPTATILSAAGYCWKCVVL